MPGQIGLTKQSPDNLLKCHFENTNLCDSPLPSAKSVLSQSYKKWKATATVTVGLTDHGCDALGLEY